MLSVSSKMFEALLIIRRVLYGLFTKESRVHKDSSSKDIEAMPLTLLADSELSPRPVVILTNEKNDKHDVISTKKMKFKRLLFSALNEIIDIHRIYKAICFEKWMIKKFCGCISLRIGVAIIGQIDNLTLMFTYVQYALEKINEDPKLQNRVMNIMYATFYNHQMLIVGATLLAIIHSNDTDKSDVVLMYGFVKFFHMIMYLFSVFASIISFEGIDWVSAIRAILTVVIFGYFWLIIESRVMEIERATKHLKVSSTRPVSETLDKSENRITDSTVGQLNKVIDSELVNAESNCSN